MAKEVSRLHVVGPDEAPRPQRPGPAVLSILVYALLFGGALWYLRAKSPLFQRSRPSGQVRVPAAGELEKQKRERGESMPTRDALLSGDKVPEAARAAYFHGLATDRCDCGCGRTLADCLVNEKSCSRSPALAQKVRETGTGKR